MTRGNKLYANLLHFSKILIHVSTSMRNIRYGSIFLSRPMYTRFHGTKLTSNRGQPRSLRLIHLSPSVYSHCRFLIWVCRLLIYEKPEKSMSQEIIPQLYYERIPEQTDIWPRYRKAYTPKCINTREILKVQINPCNQRSQIPNQTFTNGKLKPKKLRK